MRKPSKKLAQRIYRRFKFFWILSTILVLTLALLLNWHLSFRRAHRDIQNIASRLSNNVDGLMEDLFQDVYSLPIYGSKIPDCKTSLFPYLQYITVNNTKISGLVISDKDHKVVCSTLPKNETLISPNIKARSINGPFKIALFEQPMYLVQQKMGKYYIGIIIFSSVLESAIRPTETITDSVTLFNELTNKNIILIERNNTKNGWSFSKDLDFQTLDSEHYTFATDPIQSIDDVEVVVYEDPNVRMVYLWYSQIILTVFLLLVSYVAYLVAKNILSKRFSLNNALKIALKNHEFYPVYQPLYDVETKHFSGVEVLLRWEDQRGKTIMPDTFIVEAETSGLIVPITLEIMEISFQDCQRLFKTMPNFHLGFNLCAAHFFDPHFFNKLYQLMEQYQIAVQEVILEITERDLIDKNDMVFNQRMQELRDKGFSLAVDDYGTGHASISYLQHFPFNYLKIDKLFVQAIGTKAITESLNEAIIQMAKSLNLIIIAEGVETEEQVNYLAQNGVRYLQGWYFSKALSIEHLNDLLKGNKNDSLH
ncbi:MAG: EAL domain-containing protein [Legionella sp.]|nr:MAG: EAL domain-containing protein [Legionella sp.]